MNQSKMLFKLFNQSEARIFSPMLASVGSAKMHTPHVVIVYECQKERETGELLPLAFPQSGFYKGRRISKGEVAICSAKRKEKEEQGKP